MASHGKKVQIGIALLVIVFYASILLRNLNESERRALQLKENPIAGDYVGASLRIVAAKPSSSEMTARISFRLGGDVAQDPVTPAVDLQLFLNDIRGRQEINLPRGRRIDPIEAVFSLDGNVNKYPFDRYDGVIRIAVKRARLAPLGRPPR